MVHAESAERKRAILALLCLVRVQRYTGILRYSLRAYRIAIRNEQTGFFCIVKDLYEQ